MQIVKKIIAFSSALILIFLIFGIGYEQLSRINAEKEFPPHGQMADIGGHRLHYYKKGNTGPSVVFESAFDPAGHLQWYNIQKQLSDIATTISYDRAGLLWSERGNNPKTGKFMARELHLLLENIKVSKPYILVGHSLGGIILRNFVAAYPNDVAGIILIDSKHPVEQNFMSNELYKMINAGLPGGFLIFANSVGLLRHMFTDTFPNTSEYDYLNKLIPALLYKSADAIIEEQDHLNDIYDEASEITTFEDIPLIVMSATDKNRYDHLFSNDQFKNELIESWAEMQKDQLKLSTNSEHIKVSNSGHYINEDQPNAIVKAIKNIISNTKS